MGVLTSHHGNKTPETFSIREKTSTAPDLVSFSTWLDLIRPKEHHGRKTEGKLLLPSKELGNKEEEVGQGPNIPLKGMP